MKKATRGTGAEQSAPFIMGWNDVKPTCGLYEIYDSVVEIILCYSSEQNGERVQDER